MDSLTLYFSADSYLKEKSMMLSWDFSNLVIFVIPIHCSSYRIRFLLVGHVEQT